MKTVFRKAKRIFTGDRTEPNLYAFFKTEFTASANKNCLLTIRADNRFAVFVNENYIPGQQYSDFETRPVVSRIVLPVSALAEGKNSLVILAYCQNDHSSTYCPGSPSLIFEVTDGENVLAFSSESTLATVDTGYVCGKNVEKISGQLSYSFRYDQTLCKNVKYKHAEVLPDLPYLYEERPVAEQTVGESIPVTLTEIGTYLPCGRPTSGERISFDRKTAFKTVSEEFPTKTGLSLPQNGYCIVDFGKETVGYLLLDVSGSEPASIDVGFGEHLSDGGVRGSVGGRNFACSIKKEAGKLQLFYPIKRFAGRYLELHTDAPLTVFALTFRPTEYPTSPAKIPPELTAEERKLFDASVLTLKCCMHEHYEDCPWREQALYAMDSRNQMLFGYDVFGETAMPRGSLSLLAQSRRPDGLLELTAPSRNPVNIPSFSLIFIHALDEYRERTNDLNFVRETLPTVKGIVRAFDKYKEGNLVKPLPGYWNFYEWADGVDGDLGGTLEGKIPTGDLAKPDSLLNAFYYLAVSAANRLFRSVGEAELVSAEELDAFRTSYHEEFYCQKDGSFRLRNTANPPSPALCQTMAVYAGLCPTDDQIPLLRRIGNGEFSPAMTLSHKIFYYESLLRHGMKEEARSDVFKTYYPMIRECATTLWETAEGQSAFDNAGSLCHGWSAAPLFVYYRL